jgi:esterase/lipase
MDAQSGLDPCWSQTHYAGFVVTQLIYQISIFQFPSEYRIGKIKVPTIFLSGQSDELIPPRMMQALYNVSKNVKCKTSIFKSTTLFS